MKKIILMLLAITIGTQIYAYNRFNTSVDAMYRDVEKDSSQQLIFFQ